MVTDEQRALELLAASNRILVFTGAGISTESGIPDFRGPDGLWTKVDPADFTIGRYMTDPELRARGWRMHLEGALWGHRSDVRPNAAHAAIHDLWNAGRLTGVVTQNIDGLHHASGIPADHIAELHGNIRTVHCLDCGETWETEQILGRVEDGEEDPDCRHCGGIIKTATVMFGEQLPMGEWSTALIMAAQSDVLLVVGSTLSVYPAADVVLDPARRGVPMIIINLGPTDHDYLATARLDGMAGELLPELADRVLSVD